MKVFVTGGSGFLGGHLIRTLTGDGHSVTGLARSERAADAVAAGGGTPVLGELDDPAALRTGMAGADIVVHAAAKLAGGPGEGDEFHRSNVVGAQRVLDAAAVTGVGRVVYVSTEQVVMDGGPLVRADETRPYSARPIGLYAATKQAAERAVRDAGQVVVRPRMIWGHGDTTLLPTVVEAARAGKLRWIGGGRQLTSTCHVDNVVEGIVAAARHGAAGEVYYLADEDQVVFRDFWSALIETQGVAAPTRTLPRSVALALAGGSELVWRALRRPGNPPLDRMTVALLADECTIDDTKARRELGYRSHVTRAAGLAEMRSN